MVHKSEEKICKVALDATKVELGVSYI